MRWASTGWRQNLGMGSGIELEPSQWSMKKAPASLESMGRRKECSIV